jgi:hypothetical protein
MRNRIAGEVRFHTDEPDNSENAGLLLFVVS